MASTIIGKDNFLEIYVNTPIEECERRDVKRLYAKARKGDQKILQAFRPHSKHRSIRLCHWIPRC